MCGSIVCLAAILLGVDARWPPLPDGGVQYVIQIEPQMLKGLESGDIETVGSDVPPHVKDVRAYQIAIGTQRLAKNKPTPNVRSPILDGVDTEWIRLPAGGVECRVWIKPEVLDELEKPGRVIEGKIPANVKRLSGFTITVGTKPLSSRSHYTPKAQTVPNVAPSQPPSDALLPDMPPYQCIFKPDAGSRQMPVQPANHLQQSETAADDQPRPKVDSNSLARKAPPQEPAKPWTPLTIVVIGLSASLGGNVFLLWIMQGLRSRYSALLRRMGKVGDIVRGCVRELDRAG